MRSPPFDSFVAILTGDNHVVAVAPGSRRCFRPRRCAPSGQKLHAAFGKAGAHRSSGRRCADRRAIAEVSNLDELFMAIAARVVVDFGDAQGSDLRRRRTRRSDGKFQRGRPAASPASVVDHAHRARCTAPTRSASIGTRMLSEKLLRTGLCQAALTSKRRAASCHRVRCWPA